MVLFKAGDFLSDWGKKRIPLGLCRGFPPQRRNSLETHPRNRYDIIKSCNLQCFKEYQPPGPILKVA